MHHCRMEEMVTLQYGSFATLSEWLKEDDQRTGHLKRVAEWALWGQLYFDEIRREHPTWKTTHHQEWGLFLIEHLLHNMAAMQKKERKWHTGRGHHSKQTATAEEMAPTPFCQDPSRVSQIGNLGCGRTGLQGALCTSTSVFHEELDQCMVGAGLWGVTGTVQSLSRGRAMLKGMFFIPSQATLSRG